MSDAGPQREVEKRVLLVGSASRFADELAGARGLDGVRLEAAAGGADALKRLRGLAFDVVLTDPLTSIDEDLALLDEIEKVRPGVRALVLTSSSTPEGVIAAMRARVFACFAEPIDVHDLCSMVRRGLDEVEWRDGIEVRSARSDWISLRVDCRLLCAERVVRFLSELRPELPDSVRDDVMLAFREILLNAMEHGGGFNPDNVCEISAVRTDRTVVYYVRDPGPGFQRDSQDVSAAANPAENPLAHLEVREKQGLRPGGYGLLLARNVVDEMIRNESGNEVILIKHLK